MSVDTSSSKREDRVPPRRRRPKRSVWRKTVWPMVKLSLVAVVAVVLGVMVGSKILRPFQLCSRESRETGQLKSELATLEKQNAVLERQIAFLKTPRGSAEAARKLGWVKPGEITLVLPPEK